MEPPCDLDEVRRYRLARVRRALAERDLAGIVLYDQVNTRYATDSTNMQVWSTHNEVRYVYVPTEGPVRLFELGGETVLSDGLPGVDEVLPSIPFLYFLTGDRQAKKVSGHGRRTSMPSSGRTTEGTGASPSTASRQSVLRRCSA